MKTTVETVEQKNLTVQERVELAYQFAAVQIDGLREKSKGLKIAGVNDRPGYLAVRENRLELVRLRGKVEQTRKEEKAEALEYGRIVDSLAKKIEAEILTVEQPLAAMEKAIDAEIQAEKDRAQKVITDLAASRHEALKAVGFHPEFTPQGLMAGTGHYLGTMPAEMFEALLAEKTEAYEIRVNFERQEAAELEAFRKEKERKEAEAAEALRKERLAEQDRLEVQRQEQDRVAKEQREAAASLRAEAERLEAERLRIERAAEIEKTRKEAEAKGKRDAAEKLAREAFEKAEREARAKAKADRLATLAPDKYKLKAYAAAIQAVTVPEMISADCAGMLAEFTTALKSALQLLA